MSQSLGLLLVNFWEMQMVQSPVDLGKKLLLFVSHYKKVAHCTLFRFNFLPKNYFFEYSRNVFFFIFSNIREKVEREKITFVEKCRSQKIESEQNRKTTKYKNGRNFMHFLRRNNQFY